MTVLVRDDLPWRADAWIERLVFERIATRLHADLELAERAGRAMATQSLDLRAATPTVRSAIAELLEGGNDDRGVAPTVRAASGGTVAWAIDALVRGLRGEVTAVVACPSTFAAIVLNPAGAPDSPWGTDVFLLRDDGVVYYENRNIGRLRSAVARSSPDGVRAFLAALPGEQLPSIAPFERPPGAGYAAISVTWPTHAASIDLPVDVARRVPAFGGLLAIVEPWAAGLRAGGAGPGLADVVHGPVEDEERRLCRPLARMSPPPPMVPMARPDAKPAQPVKPALPFGGPPPMPDASTPLPAVLVTAEAAAAHGLPPIAMRVDVPPGALAPGPFTHAGSYLSASGPPGGPLSFAVVATAEREGDAMAVRRALAAHVPTVAPRAWSAPSEVMIGGEPRVAMAFLCGSGVRQSVWCGAVVTRPAGSVLLVGHVGVPPGDRAPRCDDVFANPATGPLFGALSFLAPAVSASSFTRGAQLSDDRWRGTDGDGRRVLITEAPRSRSSPAELERRLRLHGPGIARLRYVGPGAGSGTLCVEDEPDGAPLATQVGRHSVVRAARIGAAVAGALSDIHRRGVVLGAVGLDTVYQDAPTARVGFAPRFPLLWQLCDGPCTGRAWPTQLACESPEVAAGRPPVMASDVYSLALLVAWLVDPTVAGGPPLEGSLAQQWMRILAGEPPRVAPRLAKAFGTALARDPAARPTAHELLRGLCATPT
jgi:hypothetical protein